MEKEKQPTIKRFLIETNILSQRFNYLSNKNRNTKLIFATTDEEPTISYKVKTRSSTLEDELKLNDFIDIKG